MDHSLQKFIDFIFPPSGESLRVRAMSRKDVLMLFTVERVADTYSLSSFLNEQTRALIHEAKFHRNTRAFSLLSALFEEYLDTHAPHVDVVIPIPLSRARMRARGYNQVLEVLRAGSIPPHVVIETAVLKRTRNTRPQTELARNERLVNVQNAFSVEHGERITGKRVILVDDVATTGATLGAAKAALLPHRPLSITCIALAH